jgi:hypothetical protein
VESSVTTWGPGKFTWKAFEPKAKKITNGLVALTGLLIVCRPGSAQLAQPPIRRSGFVVSAPYTEETLFKIVQSITLASNPMHMQTRYVATN